MKFPAITRVPARRMGLGLIALCAIGGIGTATRADSITIPWNLNFTFVPGDTTEPVSAGVHSGTIQLQPFETSHEISTHLKASCCFIDIAGIDVTAGLRFPTEARNAYQISLPYQITLSAPDHAKAGAPVTITSSVGFSGTPRLTTTGNVSFGTEAFVKGDAHFTFFSGDINVDARLPSVVPLGGGSQITFGGSGSYAASATGGTQVSSGPFARQTVYDGQFVAAGTDRYQGTQLQTEGRIDAQRAEVNLLDILEKVPVIGTAAAVANAVLDLDLEAGVDLLDRSTFTAGAMYARYTDDNFNTLGTASLNALGSSGFSVMIPTGATGIYDLDFFGLGLGFGLLQEEYLQAELQLVLDAVDPLGSWRLLQADIGDPWLVGRQTSRFQFEEFFAFENDPRFIPAADRTLSFLLDGTPSLPPTVTDPGLPSGDADNFEGASPFFGTAALPGTAPTEGEVVPLDVPEPASLALLASGLIFMGCTRKRGRA